MESGLDSKRRVSVPPAIRNRIETEPDHSGGRSLALFVSPDVDYPTVFGCTYDMLDHLTRVHVKLSGENADLRRAASKIFRSIKEHKIDDTGRIVLKQELVDAAGLEKKVFFHGWGNFFELWPDEDVGDYFEAEEASLGRELLLRMSALAEGEA